MAAPTTKTDKTDKTDLSNASRGRRSRRVSGDEREQAIRDTLEALLEERGLHSISIDDVASGAGISRSSFYFYYESKEAVLMALMDEIVNQADVLADAASAALEQDTEQFLRDALSAYVMIFGQHRGVIVACRQAAATNPALRRLWDKVRASWIEIAAEAIEAERERIGLEGTLPARELAIALLGMNEAVMSQVFAGEEPAIAEDRVSEVLTNIWINAAYEGTRRAQPSAAADGTAKKKAVRP